MEYLDLADWLLIAEAALRMPATKLYAELQADLADSALHAPAAAFGGEEFYPDFATKAAVLCAHLVKNHPLPDGNKRVGLLCLVEFCQRNGYPWEPPPGDEDGEATASVIWSVAAEPLDIGVVESLATWVADRIGARGRSV